LEDALVLHGKKAEVEPSGLACKVGKYNWFCMVQGAILGFVRGYISAVYQHFRSPSSTHKIFIRRYQGLCLLMLLYHILSICRS